MENKWTDVFSQQKTELLQPMFAASGEVSGLSRIRVHGARRAASSFFAGGSKTMQRQQYTHSLPALYAVASVSVTVQSTQ